MQRSGLFEETVPEVTIPFDCGRHLKGSSGPGFPYKGWNQQVGAAAGEFYREQEGNKFHAQDEEE